MFDLSSPFRSALSPTQSPRPFMTWPEFNVTDAELNAQGQESLEYLMGQNLTPIDNFLSRNVFAPPSSAFNEEKSLGGLVAVEPKEPVQTMGRRRIRQKEIEMVVELKKYLDSNFEPVNRDLYAQVVKRKRTYAQLAFAFRYNLFNCRSISSSTLEKIFRISYHKLRTIKAENVSD